MVIDTEFAIKLTKNILREFQEPSCRKVTPIIAGLVINVLPDWQRRELEDIQAMKEASRIFLQTKLLVKSAGGRHESGTYHQWQVSKMPDKVCVV